MTMPLVPITLPQLTEATTSGNGVFDVLMKATKAHLEQEFLQGRIKGAEYATVYLGSLEAVLQNALSFLLQKDKVSLDAELVRQQVLLTQAELLIKEVELDKAKAELEILEKTALKTAAEIALLTAQAAQSNAQTGLIGAQTANEALQGNVLVAQECKLRAEYDLLLSTNLKTVEETSLLKWKGVTEKAQTSGAGVDANSVVGKQMALYGAQADGFKRDAEQKAAKILVDSWNVRRTTDEGTVADGSNQLDDASVGRAVGRLLAGVGA